MTKREEEILNLIKKNPLISQNELSDALGITRSSVAVHITNLIKKGYIKGKGYIVNDGDFVVVIGGANVDIVGIAKKNLIYKDSNIGNIKMSLGGVGRNIAENLVRLGINTKLITAVGDDIYGTKIVNECRDLGIDLENSLKLKGYRSSVYMSVLDSKNDMHVAISEMDILENMSIEFIKQNKNIIESSKIAVIDTNIPKDVIEYIVNNCKDTKFFLDTVSTEKSKKIKDIIGKFHTIKPNKYEAEILSDMKIEDNEDLKKVSKFFIDKGVKRVFISLGEKGTYYNDEEGNERFVESKKVDVKNANGAGDAFVSGLVYSYLRDYSIEDTIEFAMGCSCMALTHEDTINPNINVESVSSIIEKMQN
ncbi:MAG: PfkB family carbohydrate kinase [Clostridium sp.]